MELRLDGRLLPAFPTQRARHLFALLLLHPTRTFAREALMDSFWEGRTADSANRSLRTDLWRIRRIVEPEGVPRGSFLVSRNRCISLSPDANLWLDVEEFERLCVDAQSLSLPYPTEEAAREFEEAVSLFRGDLLESCDEPWCVERQEQLNAKLVTCLNYLMHFYTRRKGYEKAIVYGLRLLQPDPLREHVHRCVMLCHHLMGNRPAAIRQYETCRDALADELDLAPIPQTRALYNQIKSGTLRKPGRAGDLDNLLPWPPARDPL